jgi:hypothetical protein
MKTKEFSEFMKKEADMDMERLKSIDKNENISCLRCKNQTFILNACSDFPFFDTICSQCGCIRLG